MFCLPIYGLVNTNWYTFCVFVGIGSFWSYKLRCISSSSWYDTGLVNTYLDIFRVFAGIQHMLRCIMCSLFWECFGQHMFRYIFYGSWQGMRLVNTGSDTYCVPNGMGLVNASWDEFCVLVGMGRVLSTQLRYIFCLPLNGRGMVNSC